MNRFDTARRRAAQSELSNAGGPIGDQHRHAGVPRSLRGLPSRRDVLHGLAATGLALGLVALPALAEAKPKRRKKRKRPKPAKPNQFGCLEVQDPCRRHTQCCSGICTGMPGKKRCRAHGTGTCNQTNLTLCEAGNPLLTLCNFSQTCACTRTTAGSAFCGATRFPPSDCATCKRDSDCVALGFPPGSACAPVATGACAGTCPTGLACMAPCGTVPPPEM